MKKETILTAVIFCGVGFLAGYVFSARRSATSPASIAAAVSSVQPSSPQDSTDGSGTAALPKGHPPVTDAEIVQFFESASARNPTDAGPRLKLADFLYDRHRFREAVSWFNQALRLDPRNVDARTDLATCYFNLGDTKQALDELNEALRIDPRHEPTLFNLVVVNLEGAHDLTAAQRAWRELYEINPAYPNLGQLKQTLDQAAAAQARPAS